VLTETLAALQRDPSPLLVIDTHAGAGAYELDFKSMREGEAAAAKRLTVDERAPTVFDRLQRVMREESARLQTPVYPGSPLLVAKMLRRGDRLLACELRADDHAALEQRLRRLGVKAEALRTDGYVEAVSRLQAPNGGRALVLIDPPYERGDDYDRVVETVGRLLQASPGAVALVWTPLKDLETLDRTVRGLEALGPAPSGIVGEVRLRPLTDPMRLNGCAMIALNPPEATGVAMQEAGAWIADRLGERGAAVRVWNLDP
jgi:23S rRNA (adenine2030-N6)-methyltransferase